MSSTVSKRTEYAAFHTDALRWEAVKMRSTEADGNFWFSVYTTGIYCRPSCGARLPSRKNVVFHDTLESARRAGFRPCKRCRPDDEHKDSRYQQIVADACRRIESAPETLTLDEIADGSGLSPHHFHRVFKKILGVTPRQYAIARRSERFAQEVHKSESVTDAIYNAGFNGSSRFYEHAPARFGMTPSQLKGGGQSTRIRYEVATSWLGKVLIGATEVGICAILFGGRERPLVNELRTRFPSAVIERAQSGSEYQKWIRHALETIKAPAGAHHLPLDVSGTAFQESVWRALQAIPPGQTASYGDIARAIGKPKAVRAVAQACAANPTAVAIPCHRVVKSDGSLGGYRWGIDRKRQLLEAEVAS